MSRNDTSFPFRIEFPPELPISARADEITAAIAANQVVILAGETGSGKTTQIPKMCLAAGRGVQGRIACTQPRRVAALSVSRRVAEELNVDWGREVGCKIRFNDQTTPATVIKFLTDGMLLAEVQGDPMLRDYDTVIIDEAHERSLNIDFLLGHLRNLRFQRPELKIVITSATIDTASFSTAFDDAPIINVEGRTFPVEVIYAPLDELGSDAAESDERESKSEALHYIDGAVEAIERILRDSDNGDILVFLPSERDIREITDLLQGRQSATRNQQSEIIPLFGRLSNVEQQRVFASSQRRKIVLATNIAETSLTIPGIRFVVDTGLARLSRYSPQARTRRLPIEPVAQSSADQRKGRSGRVAAGVCIRLYSEKDYLERPRFTQPEIQRANLADVILRMKAFGLGDIERFPFINMPAAKSIRAGYALLEELGALDQPSDSSDNPEPKTQNSKPPSSAAPTLTRQLTPLGRELARLPVDPTVGRMILQARSEKALREVLAIAAGLSIQDPRDRPLDKQQQADAAHRRFAHPDSDFLTLLNIWDTFHEEFENLSQAKLRRFCRDHFLSYTRMREWRDIHAQLLDSLRERDGFRLTSVFDGDQNSKPKTQSPKLPPNPKLKTQNSKPSSNPEPETPNSKLAFGTNAYRAIHRSILAGLLGNIAHLDEDNGNYKATHDRRVNLFPGSVLHRREDPKNKTRSEKPKTQNSANNSSAARAPRWIMTAEIMETSRLYARTCARLDPLWALDLGAHLVRISHSEPFWNEDAGRVMVKQRTRLYGLELETRAVSYGKINPVHATEIFIREALVNDTVVFPLDFIAHNRAVREKLENALTRTRDAGYLNLDEAIYRFYAARLLPGGGTSDSQHRTSNIQPPELPEKPSSSPRASGAPNFEVGSSMLDVGRSTSSVAELVDLVRERRATEPRFLMMEPEDLRAPDTDLIDAASFPESLPLSNSALPLNYAYKPGQADDGVTLDVSVREAEALTPAALDWAVPGHLEAKVEHYLKATPKELRRLFVPLAETTKSIAAQLAARDRLTDRRETLLEALAAQLRERFRVAVEPSLWADKPLPDHLRVRVRVIDDAHREICASRELSEIHAALHSHQRHVSATVARVEPEAWRRARAQWEKPPQTSWTFGDIPARVLVTEQAGVPVHAFPALVAETGGVALRLAPPEEAQQLTHTGLAALLERQLSHELTWLERDLRGLRELGALVATLAPLSELQEQALDSIRRWVTDPSRVERVIPQAPITPSPSLDREPQQRGQDTPPSKINSETVGRVLSPAIATLTATAFTAALTKSKADLRGIVPRLTDLLREILQLRQDLLVYPKPYSGMGKDLDALVPPHFLRTTPFAQLAHFPRYLKAMKLRAERARQNPAKDAERAAQLAPYTAALVKLNRGQAPKPATTVAKPSPPPPRAQGTPPLSQATPSTSPTSPPVNPAADAFRWLVEEFRVSLFAQELGTAEPVSAVKLDRALADLTSGSRSTAVAASPSFPPRTEPAANTPAKPPTTVMPLTSEKKTAPLKNLSSLDKLFSR